jgi:hypothetical protein
MANDTPTIHVLDKVDYSKHRLVELGAEDSTPLPPSSLRLRSKIVGLTTNNLTYARLGSFMGWFDIFPLPSSTPEPYNDTTTYGRIAAWGYAEVVESTYPGISAGQTLYGFIPISTGLEIATFEPATRNGTPIANQIVATNAHRQHLWKIYNRYRVGPSLSELYQAGKENLMGFDALMQGLFATGYNLSKFGFAWTDEARLHPSGQGEWSAADADLRDAAIVCLNASGKTAMAFAWCLRHCRPTEHQPLSIIGVGSEASVPVITSGGLYDSVVLNSAAEATKAAIEASGAKRVILVEFGSRPGTPEAWMSALQSSSVPFTLITVGAEVKPLDPAAMMKRLANVGKMNMVHAGLLREKGIESGGEEYFKEFDAKMEEFVGSVKGVKLEWGEGMEGWKEGWEGLCEDRVRADRGLVYKL